MELTSPRPPLSSPRAPLLVHGGAFQLGLSPIGSLTRPTRHSPRQLKLQRVAPMAPTPAMPFRDRPGAAAVRQSLFQFHQLLRDTVATSQANAVAKAVLESASLSAQSQCDREVLALLTSDRGDAVLRAFFQQWLALQRQSSVSHSGEDTSEVLWEVLETLFRNLPLVIPEREAAADPKAFARYLDALKALRAVLVALLFAQPGRPTDDADDEEEESAGSRRFTAFSAKPHRRQQLTDSSLKRLPLFEHCRQLERELQTLRRRVSIMGIDDPAARGRRVRDEDVGLLHEATELLLLEFWQLPRGERLAFFSQVASQTAEDDAAAVLKVFVENSSAQNFAYAWDALQTCPQFERALHVAAAAIAAEMQPSPSLSSFPLNEPPTAPTAPRAGIKSPLPVEALEDGRRASVRTPGKRSRFRSRDSRFVDLNGITEGFDDVGSGEHSDESECSADGDEHDRQGGSSGRQRLKQLFIRERGRTPPNSSAVGRGRRKRQQQQRNLHRHEMEEHGEDGSSGDSDEYGGRKRSHRLARRDSGLTLVQKLHGDLIELIKEEYSPTDHEALRSPTILDAGWKLLEALESSRSGSKSGYHRRNVSVVSNTSTSSSEQPHQRSLMHSGMDDSRLKALTAEQQFVVQVDQLQAMLSALSSVSIEEMGIDVITSVYRRLPLLSKLFSSVSNGISEAAGVATPAYDVASLDATATVNSAHGRKFSVLVPLATAASPADVEVEPLDVDAVSELLGKLSKFVRSLVPVIELSDANDKDHALAIMKLADDMDMAESQPPEGYSTGATTVVGTVAVARSAAGSRRHSSIEYERRLEIMSRLRALAKTSDFDHVAMAITATVNDVLQTREAMLVEESKPSRTKRRGPTYERDADDLNGVDGEDEVDEVIRLAKSAKSRRASVKAAAASASASKGGEELSNDDAPDNVARSNRDIPMNIRHANASKGIKLFSVGILLRVIDQLYRDNYECTVPTLQYGNRRMEFSEFMYDWHIRKYGLKALAQRHLLKLIQSLRKYEHKVFQCQLCLRFLGIQSPLGYHEHKFVLGLLDRWSLGTFSGASKHRVALTKQQYKVRVTFAVATVQEALSERFGTYFRSADAVAQQIRGRALPGDDEFIRENDLLQIAVDEWLQQRVRISQVLQAVYAAGDLNGDGSLEFDEFAAVIAHLSPAVEDLLVQKAFAAAHDLVKPRRISFERFLDVVLLECLLSTSALGGSASPSKANTSMVSLGSGRIPSAIASAGADERRGAVQLARSSSSAGYSTLEEEEAYQFTLLQETWSNDRDAVMGVLKTGIPHAPTAASLTFRVAFLDQLLAKRVDAKTAWLCHRQILREVGRYQDLDAEQIVVLKSKEERFKKAVLAIRNMQQLGAQFVQLAAAKRASSISSSSSSSETASTDATPSLTDAGEADQPVEEDVDTYMSAVDKTLQVEETNGDTERPGKVDAVVAALENQLRQQFVERADERAIDDYMAAMQRLHRVSVLSLPSDSALSPVLGVTASDRLIEGDVDDLEGDDVDGDDGEEQEGEDEEA